MSRDETIEHRGCRLSYRIEGDGPGVLLIQGTGVHGEGWRPQLRALVPRYRCLSFDNRGIGHSQPVGAPLSIEQMAEDARVLMDVAGFATAHVVGHSLGGLVALDLALRAGARIRSLSLLCSFARGRDATHPSPRLWWSGLRARVGTRRMRRRAFLETLMPPRALRVADRDAVAAALAPLFGHDLAEQPPIVKQQIAAMETYDARGRLRELSAIPTLVVSAADDRVAPAQSGREIAAGIGASRYVELAAAAHGVPMLEPERINPLLLDHLSAASRPVGPTET